MRRLPCLLALLALAACADLPFGLDGDEVAGTYRLVEVNGSAVPVLLDPETACPVRVEEGEMHLSPAHGVYRSFYSWFVMGKPACAPAGQPARPTRVDGDGGEWILLDDVVRFSPSTTPDGKRYRGEVKQRGQTVQIVLQRPQGERYTFERVFREGDPVGLLLVAARDEAGAMVKGTALEIRTPDGRVSRAAIAYDQPFGTAGPVGTWQVGFTPPPGYEAAPGQPNPAPVEVKARAQAELVIRLRRAPG